MIVTNTVNQLGGLNGLRNRLPSHSHLGINGIFALLHPYDWTPILLANS